MARKSRKAVQTAKVMDVIAPGTTAGADDSIQILEAEGKLKPGQLLTAAYIRLSVENNGNEDEESIKTQTELVHSYIKEHPDLHLAETYIDHGFTGTKFDRPEFVRMMEDVKRGRIQCIVVKDLSRFGRDYLETGYYMEAIFPLLNVRFIAVTDNFDSTREEDRNSLSVPIKNLVNAMYAKDYSRKQEAFRMMASQTGKVSAQYQVYGYKYNEEANSLQIDESLEPYVRMIFAWALHGVSRIEIAKRMELIGTPTPFEVRGRADGDKWKDSTIKSIIYNPVYAGFHVMEKSKQSLYRGVETHRKKREDWLYFPSFHEPYITLDEYQQIDEMVKTFRDKNEENNRLRKEAREKLPDMFPKMVWCGDCGRRMMHLRGCHHRGYDDLAFGYYRCRSRKGEGKCSNKHIQENFLKIIVMDQIRHLIKVACDKDEFLRMAEKKAPGKAAFSFQKRQIYRMDERIRELDDKLLKAYMDYAEKILDEEEYQYIKSKMSVERANLQEKRSEQETKLKEMELAIKRFHMVADELKKYADSMEFSQELVKELIDEIWLYEDGQRVEIKFKCQDVFTDAVIDEFIEGGDVCDDSNLSEAVGG